MDGYKYYSTQRPVDIWTFPEPPDNKPVEIKNYDCDFRIPIPGEAFRAWGELIYAKPLTDKQMEDYELKPSRKNPDLKKRMEEQTQALGKWENSRHFSDRKRLTWFHTDFGSYVLKDFVTPEQLAERFGIMGGAQRKTFDCRPAPQGLEAGKGSSGAARKEKRPRP